jgi:hypothetical protein
MSHLESDDLCGDRRRQRHITRVQLTVEERFAAQTTVVRDDRTVETEGYPLQPQHIPAMQHRHLGCGGGVRSLAAGRRTQIGMRRAAHEQQTRQPSRQRPQAHRKMFRKLHRRVTGPP